jgi:hypothetical protein
VALHLFAGVPVTDLRAATAWYEKLFGTPPSFLPNDTEAVWELAEHRAVFVERCTAIPTATRSTSAVRHSDAPAASG